MTTKPQNDHPYSPATESLGLVFASGALSIDADGVAVGGRREALDAALRNAEFRLSTKGARLADVLKLTYYVTDVTLRDEANDQFVAEFLEPRPARTFLEVSGLPYGASVEIDAVARLGRQEPRSLPPG